MSDFVAFMRGDIARRLDEILPLVREHAELTAALNALGPSRRARKPSPSREQPATPPADSQDAEMIFGLISTHPGLRTDQLTDRAGNQAGRVLDSLKGAGKIEQLSYGWYPTRNPRLLHRLRDHHAKAQAGAGSALPDGG